MLPLGRGSPSGGGPGTGIWWAEEGATPEPLQDAGQAQTTEDVPATSACRQG